MKVVKRENKDLENPCMRPKGFMDKLLGIMDGYVSSF